MPTLKKLSAGFKLEEHLAASDRKAEEIQFVGKLLGEREGNVFCETLEGIYEFRRDDLVDAKPINKIRDLLIVKLSARFSFHSTMTRWLRTRRIRLEDRLPREVQQPDGQFDPASLVSWDGSHEWRGIVL